MRISAHFRLLAFICVKVTLLVACGRPVAVEFPETSQATEIPKTSDVRLSDNETNQYMAEQHIQSPIPNEYIAAQKQPIATPNYEIANVSPPKVPVVVRDTTPIYSNVPAYGCERFLGVLTPTATTCAGTSSSSGSCSLPAGGIASHSMVFRGRASRFDMRILIGQKNSSNIRLVQREVNVSQYSDSQDSYKYRVPFSRVISEDELPYVKQIRIVGLHATGNPYSAECDMKFPGYAPGMKPQYNSPIVLDFSGSEQLQTQSVLSSHTFFDIDADGQKDHTGWIFAQDGFLAMDRNHNGLIDDSSELFGERTAYKNYANGYLPLAELDSANKGYVDASDEDFDKLLVWFDVNSDGISQSWELHTLEQLHITRIDTSYQALEDKTEDWENKVLFRSRFFGPDQCGAAGCSSFDVFFGYLDLE